MYVELQDSGDRLLGALANERVANVYHPGGSSRPKWERCLRTARREVKQAAEYYAVALRSYRVAIVAEADPSQPAQPRTQGRIVKYRDRACSASGTLGKGRTHRRRAGKDVAVEAFPVSTRLTKFQ